jgi:hypothetical protein
VTSFDARGACDMDIYGRYRHPDLEVEKPEPDRYDRNGDPIYHNRTSEPFFILQEYLDVEIPFSSGRIYEIDRIFEGEQFDIVFMGAILGHLRDPIGALMAARALCRGEVFATQRVSSETQETPGMMMPYTNFSKRAWWVPNLECFRHWFLAAGFKDVDVSRKVTFESDHTREHDSGGGREANPTQIQSIGIGRV